MASTTITIYKPGLPFLLLASQSCVCHGLWNRVHPGPLRFLTFLLKYCWCLPLPWIGDHNVVRGRTVGVHISPPKPMGALIQLEDKLIIAVDEI